MGAVRGARAAPRRDRGLSEPREPLWAAGLAHQPASAPDDFFAPLAPAPDEPAPVQSSVDVFTLVVALMAIVTFAIAIAIVSSRTAFTRKDVPSAWLGIPMTCDTQRSTQGGHAFELFTCRARGGGRLPPGLYRSPTDRWNSDLTREPALGDVIRITRDGRLTGVAFY